MPSCDDHPIGVDLNVEMMLAVDDVGEEPGMVVIGIIEGSAAAERGVDVGLGRVHRSSPIAVWRNSLTANA
jgi:hypothetical protein